MSFTVEDLRDRYAESPCMKAAAEADPPGLELAYVVLSEEARATSAAVGRLLSLVWADGSHFPVDVALVERALGHHHRDGGWLVERLGESACISTVVEELADLDPLFAEDDE